MDEKDIAWFAGLFEGEGCIAYTNGAPKNLTLNMTDYDVLERIVQLFGGKILLSYKARGNQKTCWRWTASMNECEKILRMIYPYLLSRRKAKADQWLQARSKPFTGKISDEDKQVIRLMYESGISQRKIAGQFSVSQPFINKVLKS